MKPYYEADGITIYHGESPDTRMMETQLQLFSVLVGFLIGMAFMLPLVNVHARDAEYWFSEARRYRRLYVDARNAANRRVREGDEWKEG